MVTCSGGGGAAALSDSVELAMRAASREAVTRMQYLSSGFVRRSVLWFRAVARPPHGGERELLAELDSGLVERVHAVPRPSVAGGQLEEHDQLADGRRGERRQPDRAIHPPHSGERSGRGLVLGAQQLGQRV